MPYDWTGWTEWHSVSFLDMKAVPTSPGAYVVGIDKQLSRSIGVDNEGMLDIGESNNLRQRLKDFTRCAKTRGEEGHMAGWRFAFFRFERHYPFASLRVRWIPADTKEAAYEMESRVMMHYLARHGELPPLNYSFNWSAFEKDGYDIFDKEVARIIENT